MKELMEFINQMGFPIVVAMYTLIRLEKSVNQNTKVMADNNRIMALLVEKINPGGNENVGNL